MRFSLVACRRIFVVLRGLAWSLDPAKALTQYAHRVWRDKDGLPKNSVQAIAQTRDGYIWIGTQGEWQSFNLRLLRFSTLTDLGKGLTGSTSMSRC
ncbi:MAG: two-component regulator propeller domain-containing protein [Pseudomonadota bacterium]